MRWRERSALIYCILHSLLAFVDPGLSAFTLCAAVRSARCTAFDCRGRRAARLRLQVNDALREELKTIHALSITKTATPSE